ncbi:hypothetical protein ACWHA1_40805 [Streptomyces decoyicus]
MSATGAADADAFHDRDELWGIVGVSQDGGREDLVPRSEGIKEDPGEAPGESPGDNAGEALEEGNSANSRERLGTSPTRQ